MIVHGQLTDQELIVLLKKDSKEAYAQIYDRYNTLLLRHAYKKTGDADEAQDILQDVFLTLWHKREQIAGDDNLSGYLYTAVRNKALNLFAQKKVRTKYEVSLAKFALAGTVLTDHLVREHQLAEIIDREINAMPPKMQEIFRLSRKEHLKNKEIAGLLGLSEHTVATQLKRALKLLHLKLGVFVYLLYLLHP